MSGTKEAPGDVADAVELVLEHMKVVDVRPGDTIVLRSPNYLTAEGRERMKASMTEAFPLAAQIIVLEGGIELGVVR